MPIFQFFLFKKAERCQRLLSKSNNNLHRRPHRHGRSGEAIGSGATHIAGLLERGVVRPAAGAAAARVGEVDCSVVSSAFSGTRRRAARSQGKIGRALPRRLSRNLARAHLYRAGESSGRRVCERRRKPLRRARIEAQLRPAAPARGAAR